MSTPQPPENVPDGLAVAATAALSGTRWAVRWVPETGSTNADLLSEAQAGAPAGQVLVADFQNAGRGRLDRRWEAPPASSLLVSVLLRPDLPPRAAHLSAVAVALAARSACASVAGVTPGLKWPNDLVVDAIAGSGDHAALKLGGVLAESVLAGNQVAAVVVGVGLNVDWPEQLPDELVGIATSLNRRTPDGTAPNRLALLVALLEALDPLVDLLDNEAGRARLASEFRQHCVTVGAPVRVELDGRTIEGTAVAINDAGHLLVAEQPDSGHPGDATGERVHEIAAGDVIHVRPPGSSPT